MFTRSLASARKSSVLALIGGGALYLDCACNSSNQSKLAAAEPAERFMGQCLKRQLFQPNVPYPAWDYNWDGNMTEESSLETLSTADGLDRSREKGTTRHIILIRHGQYKMEHMEDEKRILTPLGRVQAELTGLRLSLIARGGLGGTPKEFHGPCYIKKLHVSNMARAKETADIIAKHLPLVPRTDPDPSLNEALPNTVVPVRPDIPALEKEVDENHDTIEGAYRKHFYRSESQHGECKHEFEVIVCHANVIRYFVCRALQLPPEAWLRMGLFNCSITYLMIQPNGYVSARMIGDIGHLRYDEYTFSGWHGLNW